MGWERGVWGTEQRSGDGKRWKEISARSEVRGVVRCELWRAVRVGLAPGGLVHEEEGGHGDQLHPDVDALLLTARDAALLRAAHERVLNLAQPEHLLGGMTAVAC